MKNGLNLINGSPKAHKSVLRRYLMSCSISGSPAFGSFEVGERIKRPLVLIGEDHPGAERSYTTQALKTLGYDMLPDMTLVESPAFWLDNKEMMRSLNSFVSEEGIDMVIVDSLRSFHMQGENDSLDINKVFGPLTELKRKTTVVVIHHAGKGGIKNKDDVDTRTPGELSRGSGAIAGYADTTLALSRIGKSNRHWLKFETKYAEEYEDIELVLDPATWTFGMREGELDAGQVAEFLKINPGTSKNNMTQKLGYRKDVVLQMVKNMEQNGLIRVEFGGKGKADRLFLEGS